MIPLVKIRLMKIRRHPFSSFFTFFFPPIFILAFSVFNIFRASTSNTEQKGTPEHVNLNDSVSFSSIAILCEDRTTSCDSFHSYMTSKYPNKISRYDSYFQIENDIIVYEKTFDYVFTVKENNGVIDFDIRFKFSGSYQSIYASSNELQIKDGYNKNAVDHYIECQQIIYQYVNTLSTSSSSKSLALEAVPLTRPPIINGFTDEFISELIAIIISIGQSIALFNIMSWMISEREQKIDEFTKRQGISKTTYLFSWFVTYVILTLIPSILSSLLLQYYYFVHFYFGWILVMEVMFTLSIFSLAFFIQSFINSTQTGNLLMKIIILGITILSLAVVRPEVTLFSKLIFCLFPQVIQVFGLQILFVLDNFENGIDFHLLFTGHNGLSLGASFILMIVTSLLYIGASLLITYFKMKGTVQGSTDNKFIQEKEINVTVNHQNLLEHNELLKQSGELLEIKNVNRIYGDLKAVNGFSAELFKNEIFCLLGHNGAGKTTLIKMLSGLEDPNGGDILLDGRSTVVNKEYLFRNLGLCAQENIFFEYLTVSEHLKYMCEIKGVPVNDFEINTLLSRIALTDKMSSLCGTLSGGQKRKLCIALALIGNSKLILLDEPTSGMDVVAKRELWEFLKNYKDNKIIVLTTHSLDEAEYLGDRIGIMSEGMFICSGSSSYLKSKYPCGFNINFIFDPNKFTKSNRSSLVNTLQQIDNSCKVKVSSKFVFTINFANITNDANQLFENIDNVKESYGILNYTISTTTLEDVFLKLNDSDASAIKINDNGLVTNDVPNNNMNEVGRNTSFCQQVKFGLKRNFITLWRNIWLFILELVASSAIVYVYGIGFYQLLSSDFLTLQNLNYLLTHSDVYTYTKNEVPFKLDESSFYKDILDKDVNFVSLEQYDITNDLTILEVADTLYANHEYKTLQSAIVLKENDTYTQIYVLYSYSASDFYQSSMNLVMSAYLEKFYNIKITMGTSFATLPSKYSSFGDQIESLLKIILCLLLIIVGYHSYSSYILLNPLRERITNIKHLLYLSGSNMGAYWVNIYLMEVFKALCLLIFMTPILLYMEWELIVTYPLIICFTFSLVAYCCCWSFVLRKEEQAQTTFLTVNLLLLVILYGFSLIILAYVDFDKFSLNLYDLTPVSSFSYHLFVLGVQAFAAGQFDGSNMTTAMIYALANGCIIQIFFMLIYLFSLLLLEKRVLGRCWNNLLVSCSFNKQTNYEFGLATDTNMYDSIGYSESQVQPQNQAEPQVMQLQTQSQTEQLSLMPQDQHQNQQQQLKPIQNSNMLQPLIPSPALSTNNKFVELERNKVLSGRMDLTLIINQLRKTFYVCCKKNIRAVNDLYLALEQNEKFGLLGFNGSGKTTTFKAITNEIFYDRGSITLFGTDTQTNFEKVRKSIGYCPQEDALFSQLTVEEVIYFYKQLKGLTSSTSEICERFGLGKYLKTKTSHLSGGNKRKLIFAIALMGNPSLLLLDEPSTGVDPESRRVMWRNINALSDSKDRYNMILTTHSMEEAEILCDTVSWLKQGNFVCVGNPEKLKIEFSAGYSLYVKFIENRELSYDSKSVMDNLMQMLPNANLGQFMQNEIFINHVYQLQILISHLKPFARLIEIFEIARDMSFTLNVITGDGKEGQLFSTILQQKVNNRNISEITIGMKSLEDILTRF